MIRAAAWFLFAFSLQMGIFAVCLVAEIPAEKAIPAMLMSGVILVLTVLAGAARD